MNHWQNEEIKCKDIDFGTYKCSYTIYLPWLCKYLWEDESERRPKKVCIDKCLLPEILDLWEKGIRTTGCCCGHGSREKAYIGVYSEDVQKMKDLGYSTFEYSYEKCFCPKTELNYGIAKCTEA